MRIPDPKANTTTEAYLAYKAGYLEESELKPVLYEPYLHFDAWLAYWAGLTTDYPHGIGKNLCNLGTKTVTGYELFELAEPLEIGTYTFSAQVTSDDTGSTKCFVRLMNGSTTGVGAARIDRSSGRTSITITTNGIADHIYLYAGYDAAGSSDDTATFTDIQIEKGSTATDYEPYTKTPEMLTDEEALVAYLSGVTNTYPEEIKDPYDVRIVGYLKHLASIRWPEPDYPVNNEEFYLSTMEPTHASNPEPSADIELDTVDGNIISVEAYGDTYQQTYTGKNLVNANGTFTYGNTNYRTTSNGDGTITTTSKIGMLRSAGQKIEGLLPNTVYTLSATLISYDGSLTSGYGGQMEIVDSSSGGALRLASVEFGTIGSLPESAKLTFTTPADVSAIWVSFNGRTTSPSSSAPYPTLVMGELQLEKGSTVTSYEPYVGGIPAPNQEYPQDIHTVTGTQVVKVCGKNLLKIPDGLFVTQGLTVTRLDNTITVSGKYTGSNNYKSLLNSNGAIVALERELPAGTYVVSMANSASKQLEVSLYNSSNDRVSSLLIPAGTRTTAFSLSETATGIKLFINYLVTNEDINVNYANLQIEAGSTPTTYEPYQSQSYAIDLGALELCKIGDYQDYIYKSGDDWYVHKATGKVTLDGTVGYWNYTMNRTNVTRIGVQSSALFGDYNTATAADKIYSEYFKGGIAYGANTPCAGLYSANLFYMAIPNSIGTTAGSITQEGTLLYWINQTKPSFYLSLKTPTDTKITDATLVGQLEALAGADTYDEKTFIKVTANGSNLPALLKVEAYKY